MELHDGFIVGIYNYCDRWCETCAFTSRCRVFADRAEFEAANDPNLKAIVDAPPLPEEVPPPPPRWLQELIDDMNEMARAPLSPEALNEMLPKMPDDLTPLENRARAYARRVFEWLSSRSVADNAAVSDPASVVGQYFMLISSKIYRALMGLGQADWDDEWPRDQDGSAKVALLAIEKSHAAWLELVEAGSVSAGDANRFIADLIWLEDELERVFPNARAFIRPAFDEPDEVARL